MNAIAHFVTTIWQHELAFLFILARIGAFLVAIPLLGGGGTPPFIKAMVVVALTFALFPVVKGGFPPPSLSPRLDVGSFVFDLASEILIGLIIGYGVRLIFAAVEVGAEVAGMQMGFGLANAFDPISNQQVSLMRQFQIALVSLLFLAIDGHHVVLRALAKSFEFIPSSGFSINGYLAQQLIRMGSDIFVLGIKIAAPVMIALILSQIAMGVISRAVPQMQVFLMSFPLMIGIGLIVFGLSLSLYMSFLQGRMTGELERDLSDLLMNMRPS